MTISTMDNQTETCEQIDINEIEFLESIGKGSFGVVHKAVWRGHTVAVKRVETESEVNAFHNEVQQLARVNHENIIHLYGACMSDSHKCLVIEFADGGSLYHLLHSSHKTEYNLAHGISWLLQCAKAVSYLHAIHPRPLLHRDLKPPNLLLTKGAKVLKLCDFGTACELSTFMSDNRGSAAWMAPEVFEGKMYTEKCDVYSWGIILWEVLTRRVPFEDLGLAVRIMWAVHQKQRPPLISGCPKLLENLMKRCWDHDHARRPRMEEVVEKVSIICKFLKGADEPINNPPSDDSMTDSFRSPCIGSSECHTSRDVSNLSTLPNEPPIGSTVPISPPPPVKMRLTPPDRQTNLRRRSAEVSPQTTSYREGSHHDSRGHIGEGGGGGGGHEGGAADDKDLGPYWELLDTELRPIEPVLSCPESLSMFSEHKEMAKKYLVLQQEIFNLQHKKGDLEEKLSQAEKLEHLGNQRYQDKIRELENKRENLRRTHTKLRQQLEQICMRQEEQQQGQNHQEDGTGDGIGHNHPLSPP
ncbi:mitogen-activated protein kinase kinase kinase 7-like isoform X3 [Palaemon carinicauda]|uniref:mitogen-activated protein kinase kinase kinase 7-like isoform X3 n=1 Tax=Palaemon carinicauda TaxID=392227 RepID=UPI0035B641CA